MREGGREGGEDTCPISVYARWLDSCEWREREREGGREGEGRLTCEVEDTCPTSVHARWLDSCGMVFGRWCDV